MLILYYYYMKKFAKQNKNNATCLKQKKTTKTIFKAGIASVLTVSLLYASAALIPTNRTKSQQEIAKSVEILKANDSYYSYVNTEHFAKTGKYLNEIQYKPLTLSTNTKEIKVIIDNDFNKPAKEAISDTLTEYNEILENANQNFKFTTYEEYTVPNINDIVVKQKSFSHNTGMAFSVPLLNNINSFNTIFIDTDQTDYHSVRSTFSHELLHYFGAGDLYLLDKEERNKVDSIMDIGSHHINTLKANDIKFLFATLDNVSTKQDAERVNSYISKHLQRYSYLTTQAQNLKLKFGEDYLIKQIEKYTKKPVKLNNYYQQEEKYFLENPNFNCTSNTKGINISQKFCCVLDTQTENILNSKSSRDFLDKYIMFDCEDFYAVYNSNGKLLNILQEVTQNEFNKCYSQLYDNLKSLEL